MKSVKTLVLAAALLGAGLVAAEAMPVAKAAGVSAPVDHVRFGCGPGWHPNPWGRCVPNRGPVRRGWGPGRRW